MPGRARITETILTISSDDNGLEAQNRLFQALYGELREMAAAFLRRERVDHTLQPTALVHEAYMRLVDPEVAVSWQGRAHFFGAAARAMRRILVDHARRKAALKRPPRELMVSFSDAIVPSIDSGIDLIVLDDLLEKLSEIDERMSRVVELRVFGGLRNAELAHVLGVSQRTVDGDWTMAKKWLRREMAPGK